VTHDDSPEIVVIGSANVDLVTRVERLPAPGETVLATGYAEHPGGKGANQAIAAARLGRAVSFVGVVGDDGHGAWLTEALVAEGVGVANLRRVPGVPTGRALVLVDDAAENSIVVVSGANAELRPDDVDAASAALQRAAVAVAQLEIPLDAVRAAGSASGRFVLNPAPARPLDADLLDRVDVLVVNEGEFARVTGVEVGDDAESFADRVSQAGLRCAVVVTLGGRGAMVCEDGQVTVCPAPPVTVVDTTGAGDCFVGALADALARGRSLPEALHWAVAAASLSTQSLGATTAMPTSAEVEELLARSSRQSRPLESPSSPLER
jgi:ribokinase